MVGLFGATARHRLVTCALAVAMIGAVAGCGANGDSSDHTAENEGASSVAPAAEQSASGDFGDLRDVCRDGDAQVQPDEAGTGPDKLYVGVATDRSSSVRPGLNKEMWDASAAFVEWCNAAGGIGGLQIEPVELDAALFDVPAAMTSACHSVFALVGGGWAQDNLQFTGRDGSDFHQCGLVDIPGYAVSPEKSGSSGQVQPVPNGASTVSNTWIRSYADLYPDASRKVAIAYADLPSLDQIRQKYVAAVDDVGLEMVAEIAYPPIGMTDWTPLAQQVIQSGAGTLLWVGEAGNVASALGKLHEQGWDGHALLETNMYDPLLFSQGDAAAEGTVVRQVVHPVEEADGWPAIRQYLDNLEQYVPDAKVAPLGIQSTSAWLLFAVAANACIESGDGTLTRRCVLEQAAEQSDWTGGGLHARQDPGTFDEASTGPCDMLMIAKDGRFERLHPKIDAGDGEGFSCPDDGVTQVPALEGRGVIAPGATI